MKWPTFIVRFWDHDPRVNDCFGNSVIHRVKARTAKEANDKFEQWHTKKRKGNFGPRLHSVQQVNINPVPQMPEGMGSRGDRHKAMLLQG